MTTNKTMQNVILAGLLTLIGVSMADAQTAYTYVQQNGTVVAADGTAAFAITASPSVEFVNGNVVMKIGDNIVAQLPTADGGQLCVDFTSSTGAGSLPVTVTSAGYGTLYSPFQLVVPGCVEVYAPTFNSTTKKLDCTTKIDENAVLPVGTAVLLKNAGDYNFTFSSSASTVTDKGSLSGSALLIDVPIVATGNTLYTLGYDQDDISRDFGFFRYTDSKLAAGKAYLIAETVTSGSATAKPFVGFCFADDATGISQIIEGTNGLPANDSQLKEGKCIRNGKVVIVKIGKVYNLNGQEIK